MSLLDKLKEIEEKAKAEINSADLLDKLEAIRVRLLGKKGELTSVLRGLKDLSVEEKKNIGGMANRIKSELESLIKDRKENLGDSPSY